MARHIEADKLMEAMYHRAFETDGDTMWQSGCWVRYRAIEQVVKAQPTADVAERKRGTWKYYAVGGWHCSECHCSAPFWCMASTQKLSKFCPECGAMMERGEDGSETDGSHYAD